MTLLRCLGDPDEKGFWRRIFESPGRRAVCVVIHQDSETYPDKVLFLGNLLLVDRPDDYRNSGGRSLLNEQLICIADSTSLEGTAVALEESLLLHAPWVQDILYPVARKSSWERLLED